MRERHLRQLVEIGVVSLAIIQFCSAQIRTNAIRVHADKTTEHYCEVDDVTASLLIGFRLSITNMHESAIHIDGSPYPTVLVAKTLEGLQKHDYEFTLHAPDLLFASKEAAQSTRPVRIISPGETLLIDTEKLTFPVPVGKRYSKLEVLSPGVHYVELLVQAETTKIASSLRVDPSQSR